MEKLKQFPKWVYIMLILVVIIVIFSSITNNNRGNADDIIKEFNNDMKEFQETIDDEIDGFELCSFSSISELDIKKYFEDIKQFRKNRENRYNDELKYYIALINDNGKNGNKNANEIEKEIEDFKSLSEQIYQYDIDFANKIEFEINKYLSKQNNLEILNKNLCNICIDHGYLSSATSKCN